MFHLCFVFVFFADTASTQKHTISLAHHPEQLYGIKQYTLPGDSLEQHNSLHVYLKCAKKLDGNDSLRRHVRGIAVFDSGQLESMSFKGDAHLVQPDGATLDSLTFYDEAKRPLVNFSISSNIRPLPIFASIPRLVHGVFPSSAVSQSFWLGYNAGDMLATVGNLQEQCRELQVKPFGGVAIGISPIYNLPFDLTLFLLKTHLHWHQRWGFEKTTLYVRSPFRHLGSDPFLEEAVSSHFLEMVLWGTSESGIPIPNRDQHRGHPLQVYDQVVVYNHMLLAHWGRGFSHILFVDVDEYFYSPLLQRVPALQQGCLAPHAPQATFHRFLAVCDSCDPSQGDWVQWASGGLNDSSRIDALSTLFQHYSAVKRKTHGFYAERYNFKSMVDPNTLIPFHVHFGISNTSSPYDHSIPPDACGLIVHFGNLVGVRSLSYDGSRSQRRDVQDMVEVHAAKPNDVNLSYVPFTQPPF